MINKNTVLLIGLMSCFAAVSSFAENTNVVEKSSASRPARHETIYKLGAPAPLLTVMEWVKGKPFQIEPGTNVYVLVFCTLSQANDLALTNLNALQKRYRDKGVIVAAVSSEAPQQLKDFLTTRGADVEFNVAADDYGSKTTTDYQRMYGQMMLPRAYVVGTNATVLWLGHPLRDDLGQVVDDIVSGRYNLEQMQKKVTASQQMEIYLMLARQDDPRVPRFGHAMLRSRTNDAPALCELAWQIATALGIEKRDVAVATAALDQAEQISTTNATAIVITRSLLLFQSGLKEEGLAKAKAALAAATNDADKRLISDNIQTMETLMAASKTNKVADVTNAASGTNAAPAK